MQESLPARSCHVSVVTCVYKSYPYLTRFIELVLDALNKIDCKDFELVFVVDGSPDSSLDLLMAEKKRVPQIVVIELSRNFGHHYAAHAGLQYARGELVFLIDCDLEVSPLVLVDFHRQVNEEACDVVYGYQAERKGGWVERWGAGACSTRSATRIPPNISPSGCLPLRRCPPEARRSQPVPGRHDALGRVQADRHAGDEGAAGRSQYLHAGPSHRPPR